MSAEALRIAPLASRVGLLTAGCLFAVLLDQSTAVTILSAVLSVPFQFVALLRSAALVHVVNEHRSESPANLADL